MKNFSKRRLPINVGISFQTRDKYETRRKLPKESEQPMKEHKTVKPDILVAEVPTFLPFKNIDYYNDLEQDDYYVDFYEEKNYVYFDDEGIDDLQKFYETYKRRSEDSLEAVQDNPYFRFKQLDYDNYDYSDIGILDFRNTKSKFNKNEISVEDKKGQRERKIF